MELKIYDDIVTDQEKEMHYWMCGSEGVSFNDIDEFIAAIPADDNRIDILLHCNGGSISEGWAMVDKLRATGKEITATIEGRCASMAVSILLSASVRKGRPHAELLIHDPYIPEYTLADAYTAEELRALAEDLEKQREKLLDFYVERTGADRDVLDALMKEDKFISMDRAKELGFIQEIVAPASASAKRKHFINKTKKDMSKNTKNRGLTAAVRALAEACGLKVEEPAPVGFVLVTEDGSELTIDKPEGEEVKVGDSASPDGEHKMPDGTTIVVVDGVVTEIRPAEGDDPDNKETAEETIARLQRELDEARNAAVTDEQKDIIDKVNKAGGVAWLDKVTTSSYKPAKRATRSANSGKTAAPSKMQDRLAELKKNHGYIVEE